jgi:HAD superfamily hydrolase (TIGR01484 family)
LRELNVTPLSVGRSIVATWEPHQATVLQVIKELGLELQIIFNKGAVMVLPPGVNKATGLLAALEEMELSAHNVVGVGDAENDQRGRGRQADGRPRRGRDRADAAHLPR